VKIHRNYSVEETAKLLHVHKNTVRDWIAHRGLPVIKSVPHRTIKPSRLCCARRFERPELTARIL